MGGDSFELSGPLEHAVQPRRAVLQAVKDLILKIAESLFLISALLIGTEGGTGEYGDCIDIGVSPSSRTISRETTQFIQTGSHFPSLRLRYGLASTRHADVSSS